MTILSWCYSTIYNNNIKQFCFKLMQTLICIHLYHYYFKTKYFKVFLFFINFGLVRQTLNGAKEYRSDVQTLRKIHYTQSRPKGLMTLQAKMPNGPIFI